MNVITRFARFWYDFIIGDDWTIAAAVVVALAVTTAVSHAGIASWWMLPVVVLVFLGTSLWRATRDA